MDIQKEVKENVSGLQDHDRAVLADAKILYRYKLTRGPTWGVLSPQFREPNPLSMSLLTLA
jgi:hypothetical protein